MAPIKRNQPQWLHLSPITPLHMSTPMVANDTIGNTTNVNDINGNDLSLTMCSLNASRDLLEQESGHGLLQNLQNLFDDKISKDILFLFDKEDEKLKAHKLILAADSVVFFNEFYRAKEKQDLIVQKIGDYSYAVFSIFINSFYKTNVPISDENIKALMQLAYKYEARNCMFLCKRYLKRSLRWDNIWLTYELTLEHDYEQLATRCEEMIINDFSRALASIGFINCPKAVLVSALKLHVPNRNEVEILEAMIKWATNECFNIGIKEPKRDDLRQILRPFLGFIRFSEMDPKDFISCQSQYKILNISELNQIMDQIAAKKP